MTGKKQQPKANEAIDLMNNGLRAPDAPGKDSQGVKGGRVNHQDFNIVAKRPAPDKAFEIKDFS